MNLYFMLSESHPLAGETSLDLRQLKNDSFIAMGDEGKGRTSFLERCRKAGFFPNINVTVADTELMMELCRKNLGIGVYAGERRWNFRDSESSRISCTCGNFQSAFALLQVTA